MELSKGTILKNRYKIIKTLGAGGQGAVYLCEDRDVYNQKKAIKQLLNIKGMSEKDREMAYKMFLKEGAFLAELNHPGLPKISDKFNSDGKCCLVIDFVQGDNLETMLKKNPGFFTEEKVVELSLQLCDILDYMHKRNPPIVFRDLKPENIILTDKGRVKLIDFGIARVYDKKKKNDTYQVGTIGYAAPEQYDGATDTRSDIYSFGALIHHLLTGLDPKHMAPFEAEKIPVRSIKSSISLHMETVVKKSLNMSRNKRYKSVSEMKIDLLKSDLIKLCHTCGAVVSSKSSSCAHCNSKLAVKEESEKKDKHVYFIEIATKNTSRPVFLDKNMTAIGRAPGNNIIINMGSVSGNHALIERKKNKFILTDMNSTNGTYVNGKPVKSKKLKAGMEIKLGEALLYFRRKKR